MKVIAKQSEDDLLVTMTKDEVAQASGWSGAWEAGRNNIDIKIGFECKVAKILNSAHVALGAKKKATDTVKALEDLCAELRTVIEKMPTNAQQS